MVGPILYQELALGGRRARLHVFRWCYAGWLALQLGVMLFGEVMWVGIFRRGQSTHEDLGYFARSYLELFLAQHFLLLLLVTPTMTAGAIADEKTRGTLQYLLTTALRPWEILVGKLLARSCQVLLLALTGLPLLCFLGVFGGLDLGMLLAVALVSVALVLGVGAASLLASVWCRNTRDAVLSAYTVGGALFFGAVGLNSWLYYNALWSGFGLREGEVSGAVCWVAAVSERFFPLYPFGGGWSPVGPGDDLRRLADTLTAWGTFTVVCLAAAVWRLRPAYVRQLEAAGRGKRRWWQARRPAVAGDPVRWTERHVEGIAPLSLLRAFPRWLGLLVVFLLSAFAAGAVFVSRLQVTPGELWDMLVALDLDGLLDALDNLGSGIGFDFYGQGMVVMLIATLVVGARCSGTVSGERERGTWEPLLMTPLETRELIRGKLWGVIGAALPYLLAYAVPTLAFAVLCGWGALFWVVLWLPVTLLAITFAGAAGVWCSVRSKSSWRSLLGTLALTYVGGFLMYCVSAPVVGILALLFTMLLAVLTPSAGAWIGAFAMMSEIFLVLVCFALAGGFVLAAWRLVVSAEYRVGVLDRTRHWERRFDRPDDWRSRRWPSRARRRAE
ncbi:MAG: ABC transporter permease subunit [Gemmataceae bacterium]|nr:ABC transporter permease subunit [Gemmataceae bacterium]